MREAKRDRKRPVGEKPGERLPLEAWLRRRRRQRLGVVVLVVSCLALLAAAGRGLSVRWTNDTMDRFHQRAVRVVRVIDGDTFEAMLPGEPMGRTARVRLWGINTPELARPDGSPAEPWSQTARDALAERIAGGTVQLQLEGHRPRDDFGRVLAHVFDARGRCVNRALLAAGLAADDDRWSHRHVEAYEAAASEARREHRGIWSDQDGP